MGSRLRGGLLGTLSLITGVSRWGGGGGRCYSMVGGREAIVIAVVAPSCPLQSLPIVGKPNHGGGCGSRSPPLSLSLLWHLRSTTPAKLLPCGNCMPLFYYLGQNILISHLRTTFPTLSLLYSLTTLTNVPSLCFHLTSPSRPPWNRTPGLLR